MTITTTLVEKRKEKAKLRYSKKKIQIKLTKQCTDVFKPYGVLV